MSLGEYHMGFVRTCPIGKTFVIKPQAHKDPALIWSLLIDLASARGVTVLTPDVCWLVERIDADDSAAKGAGTTFTGHKKSFI